MSGAAFVLAMCNKVLIADISSITGVNDKVYRDPSQGGLFVSLGRMPRAQRASFAAWGACLGKLKEANTLRAPVLQSGVHASGVTSRCAEAS